MSGAAAVTLALLAAVSIAFAIGRWRPDAVALLALLGLLLTGIVDPRTGFAGFGSPVLVAVGAVFVLSTALERTGIASTIGRTILRFAGRSETRLILAFSAAAGLLSGVMNSVGAMAVLLPAAMAAASAARISPSRLLLPMALGSRLGGNLTLIAGPSNLLASELLVRAGHRAFTLFEFLPLGGTFLVVGVAFMALVAQRLLPGTIPAEAPPGARLVDLYRLHERLIQAQIPRGSPLVGKTIAQSALGADHGLTVVAVFRARRRLVAPDADTDLQAGDTLVIEGRFDNAEQQHVLETAGLREPRQPAAKILASSLESSDVGVAEVVLAPRSNLTGRTLRDIGFREKYRLTVLGIWREGRPRRTGLVDLPLSMGDALLVQGRREQIKMLQRDPEFLVLAPDDRGADRTDRAPWALLALGAVIAASTLGFPIAVALLVAGVLVVVSGCVTSEEVYRAIDWRGLVFVGAMLPLADALASTGAAATIVNAGLLALGKTPALALGALLGMAVVLNQFVPSVASTALLAPLALQVADRFSANPHAFMMALIAGTGTTFTPVGNPVNLLVMGPGGYQMRDYVRVGLPLAILLTLASLALIPAVWPL